MSCILYVLKAHCGANMIGTQAFKPVHFQCVFTELKIEFGEASKALTRIEVNSFHYVIIVLTYERQASPTIFNNVDIIKSMVDECGVWV